MSDLIGSIKDLELLQRNDDDWIDRMSYRWTAAVLVLFCVVVSTKTYVGDPITCWVPVHFTGSHEAYTNSYCWIRNTYYLPFEDYIPKEHEDEKRHVIPYYQWVPLILLTQALFFFLPIAIWRGLNSKTGIDVNDIVETAEKVQASDDPEHKEKVLKFMTRQMDRYLGISKKDLPHVGLTLSIQNVFTKLCFCCGKEKGNYLVFLYLCIKVLFLGNVLGQLFILNEFLNTNYHMYGLDVIRAMIIGEDWTESPRFPRVTMCDFKVRRLGNVHRYTVQCVLPINLFNEKIYLFIWFWLVMVAALTTFGLVMWILRVAFRVDRYRYVKKHLQWAGKYENPSETDKRFFHSFVEKYLRQDGVFVFRLVAGNTNSVTLTEFVVSLWEYYKSHPHKALLASLPDDDVS